MFIRFHHTQVIAAYCQGGFSQVAGPATTLQRQRSNCKEKQLIRGLSPPQRNVPMLGKRRKTSQGIRAGGRVFVKILLVSITVIFQSKNMFCGMKPYPLNFINYSKQSTHSKNIRA